MTKAEKAKKNQPKGQHPNTSRKTKSIVKEKQETIVRPSGARALSTKMDNRVRGRGRKGIGGTPRHQIRGRTESKTDHPARGKRTTLQEEKEKTRAWTIGTAKKTANAIRNEIPKRSRARIPNKEENT